MAKNLEELTDLVYIWAKDKGIIDANDVFSQGLKLDEEVFELRTELAFLEASNYDDEREDLIQNSKMELGDCLVVCTIIASMLDTDLFTCLDMAYRKINKRNGKMVDGVFVKED